MTSRVGDSWSSCIGNQGQIAAFAQKLERFSNIGLYLVHAKRGSGRLDSVMPQQVCRLTCVLAKNQIHSAQNTKCSDGHIFQVSQRSGHYIETGALGQSFRPGAPDGEVFRFFGQLQELSLGQRVES